ncbi:MAG: uL15 family ribosomal protein [Candidatus Bathyarchaeia archaeon]
MPTRLRKTRRLRGSRSHGWGQVGQHRGAGRRGGHGITGGHKHHWTSTLVYGFPMFGKHGFKRAWIERPKTINVGELNSTVNRLLQQNLARKEEDGVYVDLDAIGVQKLLGAGKLDTPLILKVSSYSNTALKKVQEAKGRIISEES